MTGAVPSTGDAGQESRFTPAPAAGAPTDAVRAVFEAFSRRDPDALCDACSPEVVFRAVTGRLANDGEPYRGHAGMRRYLRDAARVWEEVHPEPQRVEVRGDVILVTGRIYAWGAGRVVDQPAGWTFRLRDGLVVEAAVHEAAADAVAASA